LQIAIENTHTHTKSGKLYSLLSILSHIGITNNNDISFQTNHFIAHRDLACLLAFFIQKEFVERRSNQLRHYLTALCQRLDIVKSSLLRKFLDLKELEDNNDGFQDVDLKSNVDGIQPMVRCDETLLTESFAINDGLLIEGGNGIVLGTGDKSTVSKLDVFVSGVLSKLSSNDDGDEAKRLSRPLGGVAFYKREQSDNGTQKYVKAKVLAYRPEVTSLAFDDDHRWLFVGLDDGFVQILNPSPDYSYVVEIMRVQCKYTTT
jgi:hypothetical protein